MNRFYSAHPLRGLWARVGVVGMAMTLGLVVMGLPGVVNRAGAAVQSAAFVARPGSATDISEGANGSVWITGTNPVPGGFGIYRWTGRAWSRIPGGAVSIAVGPDGNAVMINSAHRTYAWTGRAWVPGPGTLTDVAVGADNSLWAIGTNPAPGGFGIYRWSDNGWVRVAGGAVTIAVGPDGNAVMINSAHRPYAWTGSAWVPGPGTLTDVAVGADNSLWAIGTNPAPGGFGIYRWSDNGWVRAAGGAVSIAVGPTGTPWIINSSHHIYSS